jgi:ribosomal protein L29
MINPLIDNLSNLTDVQLETKVMELQRKYFQSHNQQVKSQIVNILEIYKNELYTRRTIAAQRQREQYQENGGNDLDSLINIS